MAIYDTLGPEGWGSYRVDFNDGFTPELTRVHKKPEGILIPGFVDIHIHGGYGFDFMADGFHGMVKLAEKLRFDGYEALYPTTITGEVAAIKQALAGWERHPMLPGFHLEGPFLSSEYPGAQPPSAIIDYATHRDDWNDVLEHPALKIVTLAPETPGALDLIRRLDARGVISSMGHTNATYEEARRGFEFGVTHATHTYNAMRGLHHREAGALGYVLSQLGIRAELIYDRQHVSMPAASLLFQNKGSDRVLAVSDGTMMSGEPDRKSAVMWGHHVARDGDRIVLAGTDTLAGSCITLRDAFKNLAEDFGPEVAARACTYTPREAMGLRNPPQVYAQFHDDFTLAAVRDARGKLLG